MIAYLQDTLKSGKKDIDLDVGRVNINNGYQALIKSVDIFQ
jgi:hypothetical protein